MCIESIGQCGPLINVYPYNEDFEATSAWTTGGTNNDWAWGTPNNGTINSAGGGSKCWVAGGLSGNSYNDSEQAWLMSPCFDFTTLDNPWVSFKIFWECERQYDGMTFQYSLNGGNTWSNVGAYGDPNDCLNQNWFNSNNISWLNSIPAGTRHGWSGRIGSTSGSCVGGGGSNGWVTASHCLVDLYNEPSVRFRFLFGSGMACNSYDGIAIDDILIKEAQPNQAFFGGSCAGGTTMNFFNSSILCPTGYLWNFGDPASGSNNTSSVQNPSHTFSAPGEYTVSMTAIGPCNASNTVTNTIKILAITTQATDISCNGLTNGTATATAGSTGSANYSWDTNPTQNTPTANGLSAGTYTVTASPIGLGCPSTATAIIIEPAPLTITVNSGTTCAGSNISLTANGANTYNWSPSNSLSANSGGTVIANPTGNQQYTVTGTDLNGCTASATASVIINSLPAIVSNDIYICSSTSGTLIASGASTYSWSPNGSLSSGSGASVLASPATTQTYTVIGTDANGCQNSTTTTVNVNNSYDATIAPVTSICESANPIQLNAADPGGYWIGNGITDSIMGSFNPAMAGVGIHTITYLVPLICGDTNSINIEVLPQADATINASNPICLLNNPFNLSAIQTGGTWSGTGITDATLGTFDPLVPGAGNTIITYTIPGQCGATSTANITVISPQPSMQLPSGPFCLNDNSVSLNAVIIGGIWSGPGVSNDIFDPSIAGVGNHTISYTSPGACSETTTSTIIVNPIPAIGITTDTTEGCPPLNVTFLDSSLVTGNTYVWNFGDGNTSSQFGAASHIYNNSGCFDMNLQVTSANGCVAYQSISNAVCTYDRPTAAFTYYPNTTTLSDPNITFTNQTINGDEYTWNFANLSTSGAIDTNYTFSSTEPNTYEVCLSSINQSGCIDSVCHEIVINDDLLVYLPNSFSPNNDGINEIFIPVISGNRTASYELLIFNRWGEVIFKSTEPQIGWDGTRNGKLSPEGVYIWKLQVGGLLDLKSEDYQGHVVLIR